MANEITTARTRIKSKLNITDTAYDAHLLECIEQAVPRLAPYVQYQLAEDTTVSLAINADSFSLPSTTSSLQRLYGRTSTSEVWREINLWRQHRGTVYLGENIGSITSLKIVAQRPFVYSDTDLALLAIDFPAAMLPLYLFAMSEFIIFLTGDKKSWNDYIQVNGARDLDEMKDLAQFYEERAMAILEKEISSQGQ